jgi:hypothetical protein
MAEIAIDEEDSILGLLGEDQAQQDGERGLSLAPDGAHQADALHPFRPLHGAKPGRERSHLLEPGLVLSHQLREAAFDAGRDGSALHEVDASGARERNDAFRRAGFRGGTFDPGFLDGVVKAAHETS